MPTPFWVTFRDGTQARCVEAMTQHSARLVGLSLGLVDDVQPLPYPALPRYELTQTEEPAFCRTPSMCAGKSTCPHERACND